MLLCGIWDGGLRGSKVSIRVLRERLISIWLVNEEKRRETQRSLISKKRAEG